MGMPTPAKRTLNVLYRLNSDHRNGGMSRLQRIVPACPKAKGKGDIKCTLQASDAPRPTPASGHKNVILSHELTKAQKAIKLIYCPGEGSG